MKNVKLIGIDIAKNVFQLYGATSTGKCDNSFLVLSPARNEFAHQRPKRRSWLSPWETPSLGGLVFGQIRFGGLRAAALIHPTFIALS